MRMLNVGAWRRRHARRLCRVLGVRAAGHVAAAVAGLASRRSAALLGFRALSRPVPPAASLSAAAARADRGQFAAAVLRPLGDPAEHRRPCIFSADRRAASRISERSYRIGDVADDRQPPRSRCWSRWRPPGVRRSSCACTSAGLAMRALIQRRDGRLHRRRRHRARADGRASRSASPPRRLAGALVRCSSRSRPSRAFPFTIAAFIVIILGGLGNLTGGLLAGCCSGCSRPTASR